MRKNTKRKLEHITYSIPARLDRALRKKAGAAGMRANEFVVDALRQAVGFTQPPINHHDLDHLIGSWTEDAEFDQFMAELGKANLDGTV